MRIMLQPNPNDASELLGNTFESLLETRPHAVTLSFHDETVKCRQSEKLLLDVQPQTHWMSLFVPSVAPQWKPLRVCTFHLYPPPHPPTPRSIFLQLLLRAESVPAQGAATKVEIHSPPPPPPPSGLPPPPPPTLYWKPAHSFHTEWVASMSDLLCAEAW